MDLQHHYKEREPLETVSLIRDFFIKKGYQIKTTDNFQSEIGTWTCRVELYKNNIFITGANGKGMTEEYSLASGHGELYERFCNKHELYQNLTSCPKYIEENLKNYNYHFSPSEKVLNYDEVMKKPVIKEFYSNLFNDNEAQIRQYFDIITNSQYIGQKYENLNNPNNPYYFDPRILYRATKSIGLSAGNSLEEALNQAISEIFEHEATEEFVNNPQKIYVEIEPSVLSTNKQELIKNIENNGFKIKIFDLSYIFGTPVVASMLYNPFQLNYRFNFGSFPVFDIAVERVITELYQGIHGYKNFNPSFQIPEKKEWDVEEFANSITGMTRIDENIFNKIIVKDSYNKEVFIDEKLSNEEILKYYINLTNKLNKTILYFDNSLIPEIRAVSVIIPENVHRKASLRKYKNNSNLFKNNSLNFIQQNIDLLNKLQNLSNLKALEDIFVTHKRMIEYYHNNSLFKVGNFLGLLIGTDPMSPICSSQKNASITFSMMDFVELKHNEIDLFENTIFYPSSRLIATIQIYINTGLYTPEEIINIFKPMDTIIPLEAIQNCNNKKFLYLYCFAKPYYDYYHSKDYLEIIHSYHKEEIS